MHNEIIIINMTTHPTTEAIVVVDTLADVVDAPFTDDAPTPIEVGVAVCCDKLGD